MQQMGTSEMFIRYYHGNVEQTAILSLDRNYFHAFVEDIRVYHWFDYMNLQWECGAAKNFILG